MINEQHPSFKSKLAKEVHLGPATAVESINGHLV